MDPRQLLMLILAHAYMMQGQGMGQGQPQPQNPTPQQPIRLGPGPGSPSLARYGQMGGPYGFLGPLFSQFQAPTPTAGIQFGMTQMGAMPQLGGGR